MVLVTTILALAAEMLSEALRHSAEHPSFAGRLISAVHTGLTEAHGLSEPSDFFPEVQRRARLTAIAAGMASARAVAVQERGRWHHE